MAIEIEKNRSINEQKNKISLRENKPKIKEKLEQ